MNLLETNINDREKTLEILINLSGFDLFLDSLLEQNAIFRISYLLFETVKKDSEKKKEEEKSEEKELILDLDLLLLKPKTENNQHIEVKSSKLYILNNYTIYTYI